MGERVTLFNMEILFQFFFNYTYNATEMRWWIVKDCEEDEKFSNELIEEMNLNINHQLRGVKRW